LDKEDSIELKHGLLTMKIKEKSNIIIYFFGLSSDEACSACVNPNQVIISSEINQNSILPRVAWYRLMVRANTIIGTYAI
jgi:hypothetical protein